MDTMTCLRFIIAPGVGQINENLLFITNQIAAFVGEHDVFRKQCLPCRLSFLVQGPIPARLPINFGPAAINESLAGYIP